MSPGHAEQAKSDIGNKKAAVSLNADASWLNKKIGTAQSDISMTPIKRSRRDAIAGQGAFCNQAST